MVSKDRIDRLTQLFFEHSGLVVGIARRHVRMPDQVDDIVQQVYLDFISGGLEKDWDLDRNPRALLCQITKRCVLLLWRQAAVHDRAIDRLTERLLGEQMDERCERPFESELLAMRHCLGKLPPKPRALMHRHYFEGVSMKRIAEEQQSKPGTIRYIFHRIRLKLRDCIERSLETTKYTVVGMDDRLRPR